MLWFVLGCVFGDVKALKAEVEALKDEVDELEEELDEQSQADTGEPVDTEDSGGGDSGEEPFEVPTVRYFAETQGSSGNYSYHYTVSITGDYDKKRIGFILNGVYDEPTDDCVEYESATGGIPTIYVEFWYNGLYECWALQANSSYPNCNQIAYNVAELSCD